MFLSPAPIGPDVSSLFFPLSDSHSSCLLDYHGREFSFRPTVIIDNQQSGLRFRCREIKSVPVECRAIKSVLMEFVLGSRGLGAGDRGWESADVVLDAVRHHQLRHLYRVT
eukprot:1330048-Rhodomonas_salina.1